MNANNLFFYVHPAAGGRDIDYYWSPADTFADAHAGADSDVLVVEAEEDWPGEPDEARIIARYAWPQWQELWQQVIARTCPEVAARGLMAYELAGWDSDVIETIAARCGEALTGTR